MDQGTRDSFRTLGLLSGATLTLAVTTALGYWIGHWAGTRWDFEPWGTTAGVLLGLAAGFAQIWDIYRRHIRR